MGGGGGSGKKCLFELAPVGLGRFLAVKTGTHPSSINCIDCQHGWLATSFEHPQGIFVFLHYDYHRPYSFLLLFCVFVCLAVYSVFQEL